MPPESQRCSAVPEYRLIPKFYHAVHHQIERELSCFLSDGKVKVNKKSRFVVLLKSRKHAEINRDKLFVSSDVPECISSAPAAKSLVVKNNPAFYNLFV